MPATVSSRLGSSGTSEEDGQRWQPFSSKNFRYASRISAEVVGMPDKVTPSLKIVERENMRVAPRRRGG